MCHLIVQQTSRCLAIPGKGMRDRRGNRHVADLTDNELGIKKDRAESPRHQGDPQRRRRQVPVQPHWHREY